MAAMRGEASFVVGDRTYHLVMDFAAFAEAEDVADMSMNDLMAAIDPQIDSGTGLPTRQPRIKHLGALLYGALKDRQPNITLKDAMRLLPEGEQVGEALAKAIYGAQPKADPSAEGKAPAARGTGTKPKPTGRQKG
jgi:hypothetical protein